MSCEKVATYTNNGQFHNSNEVSKDQTKENSTNMSGKPFNNFFENFIRLKGVHLIELMVIFTFTAHLV